MGHIKSSKHPSIVNHTAVDSSMERARFERMGKVHVRKSSAIVGACEIALDLLGYPKEFELYNKKFLEICASIGSDEWGELLDALEKSTACVFDAVFLSFNGEYLALKCIAVCEVGSSVVDIYLYKDSEQLDSLSEIFKKLEFSDSFMDTELMDINIKNTDLEYEVTSRMFEKTFSLEPGGAIGKTAFDIYPPAFADHVASHDRTVLDRKEVTTQIDVVPYSGKHLLVQKFPLFKDGSIKGIGVFAVDVTSLKDNERRLLESKNRLSDYVELSEDILWEANSDWVVRESNVSGVSSFSGIEIAIGVNILSELRRNVVDEESFDEFIGALEVNEISKKIFELRNGIRLKLGIKPGRSDESQSNSVEQKLVYRGIITVLKEM